MGTRAFAIALLLLAASASGLAQEPVTENQTMHFVGRKLLFSYESGLRVMGHYKSATELDWKALSGPSAGSSGSETIYAVETSPKVFFISWVEEAGTTVSQVLDFKTSRVRAFVTYRTAERRQGMLDKGTFAEEK
ncbi:MAG: phenolic acid decarboxylase [Gammaproteobacteria bacterium]